MTEPYLEAKRAIDDRSLNHRVWTSFTERVRDLPNDPLRIVEIGAGTGTMVDRLHEWGVLEAWRGSSGERRGLAYDAWEYNPDTAARLARRLDEATKTGLLDDARAHVGDALAAYREGGQPADVLIAHAVIDLFAPEEFVGMVRSAVRPGGIVFASIVFDGMTHFEPASSAGEAVDRAVIDAYHGTMTQGYGSRHLRALAAAGMEVLAAGSSDWLVVPSHRAPDPNEHILVDTILGMIEQAVSPVLGAGVVGPWAAERRDLLSRGELLFEAHQLDMVVVR